MRNTANTVNTGNPANTVNTEQAQAWNGYEGEHWARNQDRWDAVNAGFNSPLLDAACLAVDDRVLDVGCGAGQTTRLAARRASGGRVLGLDLSAPMLARARDTARREGLANISFEHGDAQVHELDPAAYDVAISRYGVLFFADPVAGFGNIGRALRPGGRAAFICGAYPEDNEWLQAFAELRDLLPVGGFGAPGGPGMFSLADADRTCGILAAAGFEHIEATRVEAYGTWGRDAADAADFLLDSGPGRHLTAQVPPETRNRAHHRLTETLRPHEASSTLRLRSTALLLTATRPR
ncbi:class I SAM-dependent methyltransferase [Streptomyces sp. NPDC093510]|uniref:class I SAM-dependent methyltransferase n=1 Tax=Streptomyces sp. NPDC093510 TaxID=3155199 RepID=UPI003426DC46